MSHTLEISNGDKAAKYAQLIPQIESFVSVETDIIANMANVTAAIKLTFGFFWVGYYRVAGDTLVLGPFQGPLACTRIKSGRGVCGASWSQNRAIIVGDVDQYPGHIACNSASKSEIVVPLCVNGKVVGVLDIDSDAYATFDDTDASNLSIINNIIAANYCTEIK